MLKRRTCIIVMPNDHYDSELNSACALLDGVFMLVSWNVSGVTRHVLPCSSTIDLAFCIVIDSLPDIRWVVRILAAGFSMHNIALPFHRLVARS